MADARFTVIVDHPFPTYHWYFSSGTGDPTWRTVSEAFAGRISGIRSNSILLANVTGADYGQFKCDIANPAGVVVETRYALLSFSSLSLSVSPALLVLTATEEEGGGGQPQPSGNKSFRLLCSDLATAKNNGWSASEESKGACVTLWGVGLGDGADLTRNYVTVNGYKLQNAADYATGETWGEYGKPVPWLQRVSFFLNDNVPTADDGYITITVNGVESNPIEFCVYDTDGRILFFDKAAATNGDGRHDTPFNTLIDYLDTSGGLPIPQPGDIVYWREGEYIDAEVTHPNDIMVLITTARGAGTRYRRINMVGYPAEDAFLDARISRGQGRRRCFSLQCPWWSVSKLRMKSDGPSVLMYGTTLDGQPYGGYHRAVGLDCDGVNDPRDRYGTGILAMGSEQSSGCKVFASSFHGCYTHNKLDHAVYFAGDPFEEGCEMAYCWLHDCQVNSGPMMVANHQEERIAAGHQMQQHFVHHNLIDGRGNMTVDPPPDYPADFTPSSSIRCIGLNADGSERRPAEDNVPPGIPPVIYNNILIGYPDYTGGGAVLSTSKMACGSEWYNNAFIDFPQNVCSNRNNHISSPATTLMVNNIFARGVLTTPTTEALEYFYDADPDLHTYECNYNLYYGGLSGTEVGQFNIIGQDPQLNLQIETVPFSFTLDKDSPCVKTGLPLNVIDKLFDFNGVLYENEYDMGPVLAERAGQGIIFQTDFSQDALGQRDVARSQVAEPSDLAGIDWIMKHKDSDTDPVHGTVDTFAIEDGGADGNLLRVKPRYGDEGDCYAQLHLTKDLNKGFNELYIRYNIKWPDGFRWGDENVISTPQFQWVIARLLQGIDPATPGSPSGGNSYKNGRQVVFQFEGQVNNASGRAGKGLDAFNLYCETNYHGRDEETGVPAEGMAPGEWGSVAGEGWVYPTALDDNAHPALKLTYADEANPASRELIPGTFRSQGGGACDIEGDTASPTCGMFVGSPQTFHTVEFHIRLASTIDSNDGVFEIWFDDVLQQARPLSSAGYTRAWADGEKADTMSTEAFDTYYNSGDLPGLPTAQWDAGINCVNVVDMSRGFTLFGHSPPGTDGEDGGVVIKDIVISTDRIGHDHEASYEDNTGS